MKYTPHAYQERAIKFLLQNPAAGLFMDPGLGKTSITLAATSILQKKGIVNYTLVVAPLRVVYSVWPAEVEKWDQFRHLDVGVLHGPHKEKVLDEEHDIYLINPEGLLWLFDTGRYREFDHLVVDECFAAGTGVVTKRGTVPIEDVVVGDYAMTSEGWRPVTNTFKGCASTTTLIHLSNGESFECTENHEVWTQEAGWVKAADLSNHTLVDVPSLWERVPSLPDHGRETSSSLLTPMRGRGEAWLSQLEQGAAYARGVSSQALRNLADHWAQAVAKGREWARANGMRVVGASCLAGGGVDFELCGADEDWQSPIPLQAGSSTPCDQEMYRSRRGVTQSIDSTGARCAQRVLVDGPRVESVSRVERHGSIPVYDIEVAGAHEYVVAGVRVHNSTKFKHSNTKRFKAMRKMVPHFDRRNILTGTPAPNGLLDLFGQVFILDGGKALMKYVTHYRAKWFTQDQGGYNWYPKEGAKKEIYERISPIVMRLDQKDYLTMPHKMVTNIVVDLPAKARQVYDEMEEIFVTQLEAGEIVAANAAVASSKLRQIASGGVYVDQPDGTREVQHLHDAKTEACVDLVEQFQGQPTIIAYDTNHDLARLRKAFGKDLPYIGGGVSAKRGDHLAQLWNQEKLPILALHPASAAHGLNLQHGGCHCIWYTVTWDLEQYDQLIRRVWRQGQDRNVVFIYHIIARNTVDSTVLRRLGKKDEEQSSLLDALRDYYRDKKQGGAICL